MTDRGLTLPVLRHQLVTAVLTLAAPGLQDADFDPAPHLATLLTDACDATAPVPWLGHTLRTPEEAALTADLGTALRLHLAALPPDPTPTDHLRAATWHPVTTTAAHLARLLVRNDHHADTP
ncbi:SCO4402 family protein [Kitasatospora griseola]|uniref:SCO4402 family protein n=1 Tax=Kitasatospora griseola TaxID=2064 RepID=UPI003434A285